MRVVGPEGEQVGIVSREDALRMAEEAGVDLVEIAPQADPPVCRVMDYGKHVFQESKRRASARKKQAQVQVKEMKFRPGTGEGDYQVKLRKLIEFITEGDKAKVTLMFRGREMAHQEIGVKLLRRVEADLAEIAKVEQFPRLEGRFMTMMLGPKK
jgi:translation initiation factor IF-3